jgi:hypothetical protein
VKDIGTLRRLMACGPDKVRAHAPLNLAAYNLTSLGNLLARNSLALARHSKCAWDKKQRLCSDGSTAELRWRNRLGRRLETV